MSSQQSRLFIVLGLVAYTAMWGLFLASLWSIAEALNHAEAAVRGDIGNLTAALGRATNLYFGSVALGLGGFVTVFLGLKEASARASWMYQAAFAVSVSFLLFFPVGTLLGICGLRWLRKNRAQFFPPAPVGDLGMKKPAAAAGLES